CATYAQGINTNTQGRSGSISGRIGLGTSGANTMPEAIWLPPSRLPQSWPVSFRPPRNCARHEWHLLKLVIPARRFSTAEGWSSGDPAPLAARSHWIPAFAGMTKIGALRLSNCHSSQAPFLQHLFATDPFVGSDHRTNDAAIDTHR